MVQKSQEMLFYMDTAPVTGVHFCRQPWI